ncbi:peptidase M48 Ste24p [Pseudoxanthomonas broegbernensis]|uniref:Peptidase M48 Ste24p n=1 Tax=Pseudoxanthomonas broegbernensis TaxID=83619 RepID=A0A7V8GLV8_9GAMM|nr:M48 family metallopeptidase [Pseudoxanthomonas broegbernensis]KAF1686105.1 peptidase M48 Ste24p [Pseudoxanthomonas broegbernensis]MBB6063800.1 Zn-dependent protease with chaperone function [Pseudoxanthomonas broegbernensis]
MNFFERQAAARRGSGRLVVLFALAVLCIVLAVDAATLLLTGSAGATLAATVATLAVIGLGSLYRIASLRGGGAVVAAQLGGTWVPEDTRDPSLRRLRNVVEEVAIASGVPVPKLFVMEQEPGINAFAAGYSPSDAAIAVTRGALDRLNRDELQGVIAHEFSHVLNGDMRLNVRLMGVLFGIMMLALIGQRILIYGRGGRSRNGGAVLVAALVAMVVGGIGVFFGRLIKAGVSRQREYLADAAAVQFTRQTRGLAGALKKIGGLPAGSRLDDKADAEEIGHMLFGQGRAASSWLATHPPLAERIRRLEPSFDARQLQALQQRWRAHPPDGLAEDVALGLAQAPVAPPSLPASGARMAMTPPQVAGQVGAPAEDDYRHAHDLVEGLPESLRELARGRATAMPLLAGLLLEADPAVAARQRSELVARCGEAMAAHAFELRRQRLEALHPMQRLPLAALAFPALRQRPRPELDAFLGAIEAMVHADGQVSVFEYCLSRLLQVQVREALDPSRHARFGRRKASGVREEFATLLAVLAQAGHPDQPLQAQRAYLAGLQRVLPRDHVAYAPPAEGVRALDAVWEPLDALAPPAKQVLVEALVDAVSHDGRVGVAEAELLRTVCALLHCPLPAMLERGR